MIEKENKENKEEMEENGEKKEKENRESSNTTENMIIGGAEETETFLFNEIPDEPVFALEAPPPPEPPVDEDVDG